MRILIAEDEPVSRTILREAVKQLGHECLVAEDGRRAWELFQRAEVDVVISDRRMPGIDGIELCRLLRQHPHGGYTYFIFLTALSEKADLLAGITAGADDYLAKPLDLEDLQVRLIVAARITALHRQLAEQTTTLELLNTRLFEQARHDALTQLGNRLRLKEDLERMSGWGERYGHSFCAVMCDVDHFKAYNDHYGHLAGDHVLRTVAQTIAQECRSGDLAYRYGGEEFLILLPEQRLVDALRAAERLRQAIERLALPHAAKSQVGVVTISAGVAELKPGADRSFETWLQNADAALYRAKNHGRNRVVAFSDGEVTGGSNPYVNQDNQERAEEITCPVPATS